MTDDTDKIYPFRPKTDRPKINVGNQLAARRAINSILQAQRIAVTSRAFHGRKMTARVLVKGKLYDVNAAQFVNLQAGDSPEELWLEPVPE